ncbi:hypothetical protein D3C81_1776820 [compost metagenome]
MWVGGRGRTSTSAVAPVLSVARAACAACGWLGWQAAWTISAKPRERRQSPVLPVGSSRRAQRSPAVLASSRWRSGV